MGMDAGEEETRVGGHAKVGVTVSTQDETADLLESGPILSPFLTKVGNSMQVTPVVLPMAVFLLALTRFPSPPFETSYPWIYSIALGASAMAVLNSIHMLRIVLCQPARARDSRTPLLVGHMFGLLSTSLGYVSFVVWSCTKRSKYAWSLPLLTAFLAAFFVIHQCKHLCRIRWGEIKTFLRAGLRIEAAELRAAREADLRTADANTEPSETGSMDSRNHRDSANLVAIESSYGKLLQAVSQGSKDDQRFTLQALLGLEEKLRCLRELESIQKHEMRRVRWSNYDSGSLNPKEEGHRH